MNEDSLTVRFSFEWHSLLRDILLNFWIVILAAAMAFMGVYIASHSIYKPVYNSTATLIVRVKSGTFAEYSNLSVSTEMAKIYADVLEEQIVLDRAVEYLGQESFNGTLTAYSVTNTNIINLIVTAKNPMTAYKLLNAVLAVYSDVTGSIFENSVITVVSNPKVPRSSTDYITDTQKKIIIAAAAVLALAAIVLLSMIRDTVKDEKDYKNSIEAKLLGKVVHERKYKSFRDLFRKKRSAILINNASTDFIFSENFQKISTKLEYMSRHNSDKVFLVSSVAEYEGKSTASVNIAIALASRGNKVLLVDMDFRKPSLQKKLEIDVPENADFGNLLSGKVTPTNYKFIRYRKSSMYTCLNKTRHEDYTQWLYSAETADILEKFRSIFDFIIIDTPPMSIAADVTRLSSLVDKMIMVVRTDVVYSADINDALLLINDSGGKVCGCILNNVWREFSLFGQAGVDESGYYYKNYKSYSNYSKYSQYTVTDDLYKPNAEIDIVGIKDDGGEFK